VLATELDAGFVLGFKSNTAILVGSIQNLVCDISLASSNIGPLDIIPLVDALLKPLCQDLPAVANPFLAQGIQVPSAYGFSLVTPVITVGKGYLGVSSSLSYKPPAH
jgi:hypothetical protein